MRNWTGMTVLFYNNNSIGDDPNSILVRQEHNRQSERAMTHDSFSSLSLSLSHSHNSITPSPISLTEKMTLRGKGLPSTWDVLAAEARQSRQAAVQVVDLAGGPGCCAAGACSFFHEWLGAEVRGSTRSDQISCFIG